MKISNKLLIIDMLFEGGRGFVAATIIVFLLSKGMTLGDIAILKLIQTSSILLGEVPTGMISDIFGHKKSLLLSAFMAIIAYICFGFGESIITFGIGEIFNALCLCFWSGAYEAFAIQKAKLQDDSEKMSKFFHLNSSFNSLAMIIGGTAGAFIGDIDTTYAFILTIISMVMIIISLSFSKDQIHLKAKHNIKELKYKLVKNLKQSIHYGLYEKKTRIYFAIVALLQFLMIPVIFYWQPFFQTITTSETSDLGIVHFSFNTTIFIVGFLVARSSIKKNFSHYRWQMVLFTLLGLSFIFLAQAHTFKMALIIFCTLEAIFIITSISLKIALNTQIDDNSRATVISSLSMFARIGTLISLSIFKFIFDANNTKEQIMRSMLSFNSVVILLIILSIVFIVTLGKIKANKVRNYAN